MSQDDSQASEEYPGSSKGRTRARFGLNAASAIPGLGSFLAALAATWSEHEQEQVNDFFRHWFKMLEDEMAEKGQTIVEIMARLDMHDQKIADRVKSSEYQSLLRKAFRDWAGTESEEKRKFVRNVLAHAAMTTTITSDDVVRLFIEWIKRYSELHFTVIAEIYRNPGSTRADVWEAIGKGEVRENSADADLFKLLFHELTTGYIIRQHRDTNSQGQFLANRPPRRRITPSGERPMKSAFADDKSYELTELGNQFVHYAMTDVPIKIEFKPRPERSETTPPTDGTSTGAAAN